LSTLLPHSTQPATPLPPIQPDKSLKGYGGWLIFFNITATLGSLGIMGELIDQAGKQDYLLAAINAIVIAGMMTCVICVFQSKGLKFIRRWFKGLIVVYTLFLILDIVAGDWHAVVESLRALIAVLIWVSYFAKSERVKATFESD
jgi:hypothetical protein